MVTYISVVISIIIVIVFCWIKKKKKEELQVPQGLQVFNEQGQLVVDLSSRLTRIIGTRDISGFNGEGGVIGVNVTPGKSLFAYTVGSVYAACKVEGNLIYYAYDRDSEIWDNKTAPTVYVVYGEY